MEYFLTLLGILVFTIILEKRSNVLIFHSFWERLLGIVIFFVIGIVWDSLALSRGHWIFPEGKNLGIKIGLMPIEEYLFIFIVPYCVITIYKIINSKFSTKLVR